MPSNILRDFENSAHSLTLSKCNESNKDIEHVYVEYGSHCEHCVEMRAFAGVVIW